MADLCVTDEILEIRTAVHLGRAASRETLQRIDKLIERFPESPDLWVLRGDASLLGGRTAAVKAEARTCFERALALAPDHREAAASLASLVQDRGARPGPGR